jgi:hypothetical protein
MQPQRSARRDFAGKLMKRSCEPDDDEADQRRSAALIGLIIILALAIAGVVLVRELRKRFRIEDCLMAGRTNCAPIAILVAVLGSIRARRG